MTESEARRLIAEQTEHYLGLLRNQTLSMVRLSAQLVRPGVRTAIQIAGIAAAMAIYEAIQ